MRLDEALVARGIFSSRAQAQLAVKEGHITVNDMPAVKPAQKISSRDAIAVSDDHQKFVSRGALKLAAALESFEVDVQGKICLDLGASTGGFSEVLLKGGAKKIYAVDVGVGQLHSKILRNSRVINLEKTHAKNLDRTLIGEAIDVIVCDVSFISLKKALPSALSLAAAKAVLIALVKPQFEVGPANIGKGGIVRPGRENAEGVAEGIADWLKIKTGWQPIGYIDSPIKGGDGNREFLIAATRQS